MNRAFQRWRMPVVSCFLKLALPAVVAACIACGAAPASAQQDVMADFNAFYAGTLTPQDASAPQYIERGAGYGNATFFTDSTAFFSHLVDTSTDPNTISSGSLMIWTPGANAVFGEYVGQRSAPDDSGMVTFTGTYTITGGWYAYMGAMGQGVFTGSINEATGDFTVWMEGTISRAYTTGG